MGYYELPTVTIGYQGSKFDRPPVSPKRFAGDFKTNFRLDWLHKFKTSNFHVGTLGWAEGHFWDHTRGSFYFHLHIESKDSAGGVTGNVTSGKVRRAGIMRDLPTALKSAQ
jgi:hypothetical protein